MLQKRKKTRRQRELEKEKQLSEQRFKDAHKLYARKSSTIKLNTEKKLSRKSTKASLGRTDTVGNISSDAADNTPTIKEYATEETKLSTMQENADVPASQEEAPAQSPEQAPAQEPEQAPTPAE